VWDPIGAHRYLMTEAEVLTSHSAGSNRAPYDNGLPQEQAIESENGR